MNELTRAARIKQANQERRQRHKHEIREAIVDAALDIFLEKGYDEFSLRQVAERIGYTATTIYRYFKDKDDLLFAVIAESYDKFTAALTAAAQEADEPLERLICYGRAYIRWGIANPEAYKLMFIHRPQFLIDRLHTGRHALGRAGVEHIRAAMAAGVIPQGDADAIVDALWGLAHGIVSLALNMPFMTEERIERMVGGMDYLLLRMLGPQAGQPDPFASS